MVRSELARLAVEPVSAEELDDAKTSLKGSILLTSENSETSMGRLAAMNTTSAAACPWTRCWTTSCP